MCVTDNGANLIKAFKVSVFQLKEKSASEPNLQLFHDPEDTSESDVSDIDDIEDVNNELNSENIFKGSLRCCAHTLQLVVHDGLAAINSDIRAKSALTKAKAVARLAAKSSTFAYSLPSGKVPPQPTKTRWSSEFRLLENILRNAEDINKGLASTDISK